MQTKTYLFIAIAGVILFYACSAKSGNNIENSEWLAGTWENKTPEGSVYETWSKSKDNEYAGKSYMVNEKDTVIFETIRLVQEQDGLFYIPAVKDENNGLPVRFAGKTISETQLVFENLQHDFPQIITYTKIGADSLVAEISGMINGKEERQTFPMKRVK